MFSITKLPNYPIPSFSFAELSAERAELLLLFQREAVHDLGDELRVLGKDSGNQLFPGRRDRGNHKAFVAAFLAALHQSTFLQIVEHQREIAAALENAARQIAQVERPHVVERLQHRKLAVAQPGFFNARLGVVLRGIGGTRELDVSVQRALLGRASLKSLFHRFPI